MEKDDIYYFHQTPPELAKKLIKEVPLVDGDFVLEPFCGEGAFFDNFPNFVNKDWSEITLGRDYTEFTQPCDWVITNPPFRLEVDDKRVNSFYTLISHYAPFVNKGIAFLGNDSCLGSLTPKRLKELNENYGLYLHKIIVCSVKKWRGRYYFMIFQKNPSPFLSYIDGNF